MKIDKDLVRYEEFIQLQCKLEAAEIRCEDHEVEHKELWNDYLAMLVDRNRYRGFTMGLTVINIGLLIIILGLVS